ncbi:FAD-dependent oxidoreductase [Sphingomonas baiyangensis]|uniref:FAD-dependent oxidoreductase n=1 Tax=Sphingomonas baiyangensis TaxID=2572576 RepID=A0A4U1L1H0_9SPHN|nr:FAD-dependent oxidoreductase [Sphingomonas baiyangensis]TKD49963.1 FAD-dependent oxidoreductase [Sphingomonas baiyangensis]
MSLRIAMPGVRREGASFAFDFEGDAIEAWPGETVMAALVAAGRLGMRTAKDGALRGPYCGMGVCGECSVLVDGVQQRACMTAARAGARVRPMPLLAPVATVAPPAAAAVEHRPDLLVIGGGAAGLSAAIAAARAGLDVVLADERAKAGGQYFKQPGRGFAVDDKAVDAQFAEGVALADEARAAGARILQGAAIWSAQPDGEVRLAHEGAQHVVRARHVIVATGAYERPHMVPGWTLPGVMTTGAAQTLLRAYQVAPGARVLVAGNGPLNLQVARELLRAGVEVVAVAEAAAVPGLRYAANALVMAANAPGLVRDGIGHLAALRRAGVKLLHRHVLIAAEGDTQVRSATLARFDRHGRPIAGSEVRFDVDIVCCGYGFLPQAEIARALGVDMRADAPAEIARDAIGATALAAVHVVGDAGAMGGARVAMAQGTLAGLAVVERLGGRIDMLAREQAARALARHRRFQAALWRIYSAPAFGTALATSDTLLCRCESVPLAAVDALLADGAASVGAIKRLSRVGMGRCQGRYCGALLADRLARAGVAAPQGDPGFAPRPPFRPIMSTAIALGDG